MNKLSPFIFDPQGPADRPDTGFTDNAYVGTQEGFGATTIGLADRYAPWLIQGSNVTRAEFEQRYSYSGVEWSPGITHGQIAAILEARRDQALYRDVYRRATTGGDVGAFVGNLVGSALGPESLIPFGAGVRAASYGGAFLRGGLEATALGVPLLGAEAGVRDLEQNPMTAAEFGYGLAAQAVLGGLLGAGGHYFRPERLAERAYDRGLGVGIDSDGNPIAPRPAVPGVNVPDAFGAVDDAQADIDRIIQRIDRIVERERGPPRVIDSQDAPDGAPVAEPASPGAAPGTRVGPARQPQSRPQAQPKERKIAESIDDRRFWSVERNFRFNRQAAEDLADIDLIERSYGPGAYDGEVPIEIRSRYRVTRDEAFPGVRIILDENGQRIAREVNRSNRHGFVYFDDAGAKRDTAHAELRDQLEAELNASGRGQRSPKDRIANIELVQSRLKENADKTIDQPEWRPGDPEPVGVLVNRRSHGNELRLKEVPVLGLNDDNAWWPRVIDQRSSGGKRNWRGISDDLGVLTREQFTYWLHNGVKIEELRRLVRVRGIKISNGLTKSELGDILFDDLHPRPSSPPRTSGGPDLDPLIDQPMRDRIAAVRARAEAARAKGADSQTVAQTEMGLDEVTTENAGDYLAAATGVSTERAGPKIKETLDRLKKRKQATKDAIVCLLGGEQ